MAKIKKSKKSTKPAKKAVARSTILGDRNVALNAIKAVYALTGSRAKTGELLGINGSSVTQLLARTGNQTSINPVGARHTALTPSKLVEAYWAQGKSLRQIGAELCLPHTMVYAEMVKYGIPRR
jgi:DNA-binding CsgD family transcriptional regulator